VCDSGLYEVIHVYNGGLQHPHFMTNASLEEASIQSYGTISKTASEDRALTGVWLTKSRAELLGKVGMVCIET
jgi:hypothetical protein